MLRICSLFMSGCVCALGGDLHIYRMMRLWILTRGCIYDLCGSSVPQMEMLPIKCG